MSRRGPLDAVIVGGGVVGATCALALADIGLDVALIQERTPPPWSQAEPDLRVYAIAPDNARLLDRLGVWTAIRQARAPAYRRMCVWDAAGGGDLIFDADALGRAQLGWIVENALLVDRLWAALLAAGVRLHCPAQVQEVEQHTHSVRLKLDDGRGLETRVLIAAEGAHSPLRQIAGIPVVQHDYDQRAVVAYIQTEHPHQDTAWQRFMPGGPLALLPASQGHCSIVWTLPQQQATHVLALDDAAFAHELTQASAGRLGQAWPVSARAAFALQRQLAQQYVSGRILLMGDAAHVVHPLAGQGVNLGLRDVAGLHGLITRARARQADWSAPHRLARWGRERRSESLLAAYSMEGINRLFSNDHMALSLLRGPLLGLAGRLPPVQHLLWRRASGA